MKLNQITIGLCMSLLGALNANAATIFVVNNSISKADKCVVALYKDKKPEPQGLSGAKLRTSMDAFYRTPSVELPISLLAESRPKDAVHIVESGRYEVIALKCSGFSPVDCTTKPATKEPKAYVPGSDKPMAVTVIKTKKQYRVPVQLFCEIQFIEPMHSASKQP